MATEIENIEGFEKYLGSELGVSRWHLVTQEQVNLFADATGDHQWIHVDPEKAKLGPFGGPIAHGYLTLSLAPVLLGEILSVKGISFGVNYGCNKVRFPSPVMVGNRIRIRAVLFSLDKFDGGAQAQINLTFEQENTEKPCCVAEVIYRYYN